MRFRENGYLRGCSNRKNEWTREKRVHFLHLKRRFQHPLYADINGNLALLDGFAAFG